MPDREYLCQACGTEEMRTDPLRCAKCNSARYLVEVTALPDDTLALSLADEGGPR